MRAILILKLDAEYFPIAAWTVFLVALKVRWDLWSRGVKTR